VVTARLPSVARLPSRPGVYRFRDARDRALYVGRAGDLRRRVESYWYGLRDRPRLRRMVPRIVRVEAVECDSEHEAAWLERNLLETYRPGWNRVLGGLEVPVYLRLDRRTGLRVLHTPDGADGLFGPYLGGLKVRLAVSALHRILPLAYAARGLRGSERDMARALGVEPDSRERLVESVTAVLDREPTAVAALLGALAERRDAAAASLAFELAGRIQAEIEAVEWIVAEQKVTGAAADYAVHGWAPGHDGIDGTLVQFEVRGGRMCVWSQRPCTERAAEPLLAGNPPGWTEFAERNAVLAARLSTG
jgi:excinuclease ABC subunit C